MKHLKIIQDDFSKVAGWKERTPKWQRRYLHQHPQSRLRETSDDQCSHCGHRLNVKDHGKWVGYHCPNCGRGGSRSKSRYRHQMSRPSALVSTTTQRQVPVGLQEITIDIKPEFYKAESKSFSFELSDVDAGSAARTVFLRNPETNAKIKFERYKTDKDATDEDIYGWHYKSEDGKYELLIIND